MNNKLPYETYFSEKLMEFPVPDMADAIWEKIELQLPVITIAPKQTKVLKKTMYIKATCIFIVIAALIALVIVNKKNNPISQPIIPQVNIAPTISTPIKSQPVLKDTSLKPTQNKITNAKKQEEPLPIDSLYNYPITNIPNRKFIEINVKDTLNAKLEINKKPNININKPLPTPSKSLGEKGVQGITKKDYKIKGKKN